MELVRGQHTIPEPLVIPLPRMATKRQALLIETIEMLRLGFKGESNGFVNRWDFKKTACSWYKQAPKNVFVYVDIQLCVFVREAPIVYKVTVSYRYPTTRPVLHEFVFK